MPDVVQDHWAGALTAAVAEAPTAEDPEVVHRLRVAARRLRVFLELGGRRILDDDLRWLRDEAGDVRDLDVLLAGGPPPPVARWLVGRRPAAAARLAAAAAADRTRGLLEALPHGAPVPRLEAEARTAKAARRLLRRAVALEDEDAPLDALHGARRAVRRLRYALEWLGEDATAPHALQDALGWLGDLRVALRILSAWPGEAPAWKSGLVQGVSTGRTQARAVWAEVRPFVEEVARR